MTTPAETPEREGLLPCPWCGKPPVLHDLGRRAYVECEDRGCAVRPLGTSDEGGRDAAVAAWNRRAALPEGEVAAAARAYVAAQEAVNGADTRTLAWDPFAARCQARNDAYAALRAALAPIPQEDTPDEP